MLTISIQRRTPGTGGFTSELLDMANNAQPFSFQAFDSNDVQARMNQLGFPVFELQGSTAYVPYSAGTGKYDDFFWTEWK